MPEIREEDLVELYKRIEDAENSKSDLEYIVNYKEKKIIKSFKEKKILTAIILGVIAINILVFGYLIYIDKMHFSAMNDENTIVEKVFVEIPEPTEESALLENELKQIDSLTLDTINSTAIIKENERLNELKEFYLAKNLLNQEKIYTVQIAAIAVENQEISLISENLSNHRIYKDNEYLKFSLGIFETLAEAQEFRKILIDAGFNKDIFIISYKNGKRLQIEPSF